MPDPAWPLRRAPRPDPPVVCPGFGFDRCFGRYGGGLSPRRTVLLASSPARPRPATPMCAPTRRARGMSGFWTRQVLREQYDRLVVALTKPNTVPGNTTEVCLNQAAPPRGGSILRELLCFNNFKESGERERARNDSSGGRRRIGEDFYLVGGRESE